MSIAVIGGGFCGLACAWELARSGADVTLLEADAELGGLAGTFPFHGARLEKFYHHWFTSDRDMFRLLEELGLRDRLHLADSRTGMYYANRFHRLSSPLDLLRLRALRPVARLRLGLQLARARSIRDWRALEHRSARDWLIETGGSEVYRVIWEPLLRGKFGCWADEVGAVWIWNKLKLRGGSRGRGGQEQLAFPGGGFGAVTDRLRERLRARGVRVLTGRPVERIVVRDGAVAGVVVAGREMPCSRIIATPAPPVVADLLSGQAPPDYLDRLRSVRYLGNLCLVLDLDRSLSDRYWINVNDPGFPFVAVIEHTRLERPESYGGRHVVYLSRYTAPDDPFSGLTDTALLDAALPYLQRMFPELRRTWIARYRAWRAAYAQPLVTRGYGARIPERRAPVRGLWLANMAQIYPQDRGTNYAVRLGRDVAREVLQARPVTPACPVPAFP